MQNIQILILYDDPGKRDAVRKFLTDRGYIVIAASNKNEAIQIVRSHSIELLLTDFSFAVNTNDSVYQDIKLINPMLLIIKLNVDNDFLSLTDRNTTAYDFEYCQKMLNALEVLEQTRDLYFFRIH